MTDKEIAELLAIVFIQLIIVFPICRIYHRAGFNWYWGLLTLVPIAGFLMIPGALGFTSWPSTSSEKVNSKGQHSLYWVAGFFALFWFGVPGGESEEMQSAFLLAATVYFTFGVAMIFGNAGYTKWGGILGLLGITNLIWPWIVAVGKWPKLNEIRNTDRDDENTSDQALARKFRIDPSNAEGLSRAFQRSEEGQTQATDEETAQPPPIPNRHKSTSVQESSKSHMNVKGPSTLATDENQIYEQIAAELSGNLPRSEGVYLRAESEADGDKQKTRLLYSKYRRQQLNS